jgi:thiosulfate dehydrogenase
MTRRSIAMATAAGCAAIFAAVAYAPRLRAQQAPPLPVHQVPDSKNGGTVVMLCDGKTSVEVKGLKPGESMTHAQAVEVTRELMAQWQREHPSEKWQMAQAGQSSEPPPVPSAASGPAPAAKAVEGIGVVGIERAPPGGLGFDGAANVTGAKPQSKGTQQGDTYASFTDRDYKVWKNETDNFVAEGNRIFHDSKELGGTIGVSCDMCHPDGSNTHPETYPKYQVQLQRVALLRDMIDWCIENPVKGKALDPNDPKLRALEAYILAQRKGVPLAYGKH